MLAVGSSRRGPGRYRRPSASAGRAVLSSTERDRSGRCPAASWSTSRAASAALTVGAVSTDRSPTSTVEVPPWRCGAPGGRTHPVTGSPAVPGPGSVTGPGPAEPKSPPCRHRQPRPTPPTHGGPRTAPTRPPHAAARHARATRTASRHPLRVALDGIQIKHDQPEQPRAVGEVHRPRGARRICGGAGSAGVGVDRSAARVHISGQTVLGCGAS